MTEAIETFDLGRRFGKQWALQGCTFSLPAGMIAGLVGPNGAGKTTLMHMLVGLLTPTSGTAMIFGLSPIKQLDRVLPNVGFVGQDHPLYRTFTVKDMLRFGRELNPHWDDTLVSAPYQRTGYSLGSTNRETIWRTAGTGSALVGPGEASKIIDTWMNHWPAWIH